MSAYVALLFPLSIPCHPQHVTPLPPIPPTAYDERETTVSRSKYYWSSHTSQDTCQCILLVIARLVLGGSAPGVWPTMLQAAKRGASSHLHTQVVCRWCPFFQLGFRFLPHVPTTPRTTPFTNHSSTLHHIHIPSPRP